MMKRNEINKKKYVREKWNRQKASNSTTIRMHRYSRTDRLLHNFSQQNEKTLSNSMYVF